MEPSPLYQPPASPPPQNGRPAWVKLLVVLVGIAVIASAVVIALKQQEKRERERAALESFQTLKDKVRDDMAKSIEANDGKSMQIGVEAVDKVKRNLAKGAEMGGEEGRVLKAVSEYMGELQVRLKHYTDTVGKMGDADPFDLAGLTGKQGIADRRNYARELEAQNLELKAFFTNGEVGYRKLLIRGGISESKADQMVREFVQSQASTLPLQHKVRDCDDIAWKALIEYCDLLEAEWGKWENAASGPVFATDGVAAKYNDILKRVRKAGEDQAEAQRQMVKRSR